MLSFIVSGYIPGTDIQVTYDMFLLFAITFISVFAFFLLVRAAIAESQKLIETTTDLEEVSL